MSQLLCENHLILVKFRASVARKSIFLAKCGKTTNINAKHKCLNWCAVMAINNSYTEIANYNQ